MPDHRLTPLKKSNLQYPYPKSATSGDDPSSRSEPDSSLLNRHEWYEMLYFCNKFANEHTDGRKSKSEIAQKAERLIHEKLPSNLRSHAHVQDWLERNWPMFPNV